MSLWVVRAGRHGDQEETAVQKHLVCHAWNELPDYSALTKDELRKLYEEKYPRESEKQVISGLGQVWRFAHEIQKGDLVALPLKTQSAFEFGRITSDYRFEQVAPNVKHIRYVEWLKNGTVQRSVFPQDILFSMSAAQTVFKVHRNEAENRVNEILALAPLVPTVSSENTEIEIDSIADSEAVDLERTAGDEILKFIQAEFKGHRLADLVAAVLRAQGYKTKVSPPGPDGGVDILAGSGPLGFDQPRFCVQVKSGTGTQGQATFNELRGVMSKFGSEQGLLVSWGGFTKNLNQDARNDFFKVRLWDQGEIVNAVLKNYEGLDDEIKAELPLKRIWVMVPEEAE
jgi:restriction system protein